MAVVEQRTRLDALTSLRWFAALLVFGRHLAGLTSLGDSSFASRVFPQGAAGVSFFFVLSGFVLAWSRTGDETPRHFYVRRWIRIYPAYALALTVGAIVAVWLGDGVSLRAVPSIPLVQAWFPRSSVYYAVSAVNWSLSVEAFFYAVFPAVLPRLQAMSVRQQQRLLVVAWLVPFVIAGALYPAEGSTGFWALYIFPPARLCEFAAGLLLALLVRRNGWPRVTPPVGLAVAAAGYVAAGFVPDPFMWVATTFVPFTVLIGSVAMADATGSVEWLRPGWLVWLGECSYAFYLLHGIALFLVVEKGPSGAIPIAVGSFTLALVASAAMHMLWERPTRRWLLGRASG
jgi:peptidoglycan/LPS O-acetylase OafA/YrhL